MFAQDRIEYVDRAERFRINLPRQPTVEDATYLGDNDLQLPARVYRIEDSARRYSITVVDYSSVDHVSTVRGAISWAAWQFRKRGGEVTYDAYAQVDRIEGHQIHLVNADATRTYAGIYLHAKRLYILEATVPPGYPPPLEFQQALVILDENGEQVRYALDADGQRVRIAPGVE
ncbi:MAG TPA: hypothetical protein VIV14_09885 [Gammaproteobacteria bacterium]